ncbi:hypothetical protein HanIR_Chr13g0623921 [Helianthus annuus]|nr:hypothetical protein HanIR_Chr13g0623921 [Helianthus annuus]
MEWPCRGYWDKIMLGIFWDWCMNLTGITFLQLLSGVTMHRGPKISKVHEFCNHRPSSKMGSTYAFVNFFDQIPTLLGTNTS